MCKNMCPECCPPKAEAREFLDDVIARRDAGELDPKFARIMTLGCEDPIAIHREDGQGYGQATQVQSSDDGYKPKPLPPARPLRPATIKVPAEVSATLTRGGR